MRIKLEVFVDLDPTPGYFHSKESARNIVDRVLKSQIGHYNPIVSVVGEVSISTETPLTADQLLQKTFPQDYNWPLIPVNAKDLLRVGLYSATVGQNDRSGDNRPYIGMCSCGWLGHPMFGEHNSEEEAASHIQTHKE